MKYYILGLFVSIFSMSSFASSVMENVDLDFHYSDNRSFYACSYAESRMETFVEAMGGEIESMRCIGGLPYDRFLTVRANIVRPVLDENSNPDDASWMAVNIKGKESCSFNKKMVEKLLSVFTTRNLEASTRCWDARGRYTFSFEVLK